jgi:hypothetical protein
MEQIGNFPQAFTHRAVIDEAITLDGALNRSGPPALTQRTMAEPGPRRRQPVGCQNWAMGCDQQFQAAGSYSLIRPSRTGRRRTLPYAGLRHPAVGAFASLRNTATPMAVVLVEDQKTGHRTVIVTRTQTGAVERRQQPSTAAAAPSPKSPNGCPTFHSSVVRQQHRVRMAVRRRGRSTATGQG